MANLHVTFPGKLPPLPILCCTHCSYWWWCICRSGLEKVADARLADLAPLVQQFLMKFKWRNADLDRGLRYHTSGGGTEETIEAAACAFLRAEPQTWASWMTKPLDPSRCALGTVLRGLSCEPCGACDAGTGLSAGGQCTSTSDIACAPCADGTFSPETTVEACQTCSTCAEGTGMMVPCTPATEVVCAPEVKLYVQLQVASPAPTEAKMKQLLEDFFQDQGTTATVALGEQTTVTTRGRHLAEVVQLEIQVTVVGGVAAEQTETIVATLEDTGNAGDAMRSALATSAPDAGAGAFDAELVIDATKLPCGKGLYRLKDTDGTPTVTCLPCGGTYDPTSGVWTADEPGGGGPQYYCPFSQLSERLTVDTGFYGAGGPADDTQSDYRTQQDSQVKCPAGHFCVGGVSTPCEAGFRQPETTQSECLPCGSIDVVCPFDAAGRTEAVDVESGKCSVVSEIPAVGDVAATPLEFAPDWARRDRRHEQAACSASMSVQTDPEDSATLRTVEFVGPAEDGAFTPVLGANVTCLIPGMVLTSFMVYNPGEVPIFVRAGAPSLPWLVVSEGDRNGFSIAPGGKQAMLVVIDSSVYDNENDLATWPVLIDTYGQPRSHEVTVLVRLIASIPKSILVMPSVLKMKLRADYDPTAVAVASFVVYNIHTEPWKYDVYVEPDVGQGEVIAGVTQDQALGMRWGTTGGHLQLQVEQVLFSCTRATPPLRPHSPCPCPTTSPR